MFVGDTKKAGGENVEQRKYQIIVFGASGFTGQYVVEELARTIEDEGKYSWAVAGRDIRKLEKTLQTASSITGIYLCGQVHLCCEQWSNGPYIVPNHVFDNCIIYML